MIKLRCNMRRYDYKNKWTELLSPDVVAQLVQIHELKGKQAVFATEKTEILSGLLEVAKIQSTEASNSIEGIFTSSSRLKMLIVEKTTPHSRAEEEIAGYRDVLATIHEAHEYIPLSSAVILQLHRDLYKYSGLSIGGKFKNTDNVIAEQSADGESRVRFAPLKAWETPGAIDEICTAYIEAIADPKVNDIVVIAMFILDFLCVHPFSDGNGRMSRLLTLLLMYRSDYQIGKYISVEKAIEKTKQTYYDTLMQSSQGWHENQNDYKPFVSYMLGVFISAYREFEQHATVFDSVKTSKSERVEKVICETLGKITKSEIAERCPDVSGITIQRTLAELVKNGKVTKIGSGRYTAYIWNRGV